MFLLVFSLKCPKGSEDLHSRQSIPGCKKRNRLFKMIKHFYTQILFKCALPFLFLILLLGIVNQGLARNVIEPRLFLLDSKTLLETKERVYSGDSKLLLALQKLRSEADQAFGRT